MLGSTPYDDKAVQSLHSRPSQTIPATELKPWNKPCATRVATTRTNSGTRAALEEDFTYKNGS